MSFPNYPDYNDMLFGGDDDDDKDKKPSKTDSAEAASIKPTPNSDDLIYGGVDEDAKAKAKASQGKKASAPGVVAASPPRTRGAKPPQGVGPTKHHAPKSTDTADLLFGGNDEDEKAKAKASKGKKSESTGRRCCKPRKATSPSSAQGGGHIP